MAKVGDADGREAPGREAPGRAKPGAARAGAAKKVASQGMSSGVSNDASQLIDERIAQLGDWRGEALARVRTLIKQAVPDVEETWKWRGVPVWERDGMICTGESYKEIVKVTFAKGASLDDPSRLFNASLEGNARRAIDIHQGDHLDGTAFKALVRAAVALNESSRSARRR